MFTYALKRVTRSTRLFAALLLGVVLASTFFTGINIGADTTAKAALNQQLSQVLVDINTGGWYRSPLSSTDWITAAEKVDAINDVVETEVISRTSMYVAVNEQDYQSYTVIGIMDDSRIYNGLNVTTGASSLQINETYVWIGSQSADRLEINDVITLNITVPPSDYPYTEITLKLQLNVAGFAGLDETALAIAAGQYRRDDGAVIPGPVRQDDIVVADTETLLLVSWERTFAPLLDAISQLHPPYHPLATEILVFLDREVVITPWDVSASQERINRIVMQINNEIAEFELTAYSNLQNVLNMYQFLSMAMRLSFLVVALPVFFVAWYVGSTVSEVSFNVRRREIGLLSTKGFSSGQLFRLFLSESLFIGMLGSLIGIGLSVLLSPYFVATLGSPFAGSAPILTSEVIILAIIFGMSLTILSTFRPSRRAARLPAVDALKEYMYVEETKPYRQKWPLAAFLLGSYKVGMFLIGIPSLMQYFMGRPPSTTNIFLTILLAALMVIDSVLTPIGPLLFFWGFTKIFIRGSLGFQKLVERIAKYLGDIGALATKNVRRNPARTASVAFLIALIIGYGVQTVGTLASEEDYVTRQVNANVGADISVSLVTLSNVTFLKDEIANLPGVVGTTVEYAFSGETSFRQLSLVAVNPQEWLSTAYYEDEWFAGTAVTAAFQQMSDNNHTIILEQTIARTLGLDVDDYITLTVGLTTTKLQVVGFFGPLISSGSQPTFQSPEMYPVASFRSYVPEEFYYTVNASVLDSSGRILGKLASNTNSTEIVAQIRNFDSNQITYVASVSEQLAQRESNLLLSGTTNVQWIGVIFSVAAASIATSLVALVSLQERKKEISIMNVRGLSFKQLITMLLTENLSIVVFSLTLGIIVGLVIVHGNIVALNATQLPTLVQHRIVFPLGAIGIVVASVILVFVSMVLPVFVITRRYISKLIRIVRT